MSPTILGIDPGASCGVCAIGARQMLRTIKGDDVKAMDAIIRALRPDLIMVEGQYLGKQTKGGRTFSPKGIRTLVARQAYWVACACLSDVPSRLVMPKTWQAHYRANARPQGGWQVIAQGLTNHHGLRKPANEDEAAAVLIASYCAHLTGAMLPRRDDRRTL